MEFHRLKKFPNEFNFTEVFNSYFLIVIIAIGHLKITAYGNNIFKIRTLDIKHEKLCSVCSYLLFPVFCV